MSCWTSHLPIVGATNDRFSPYAVETRTGPHVTIQAGVVHAGRFWTTTSRRSLKARSVRAHGFAGAVVRGARPGGDALDRRRIIAGPTIALDPTRPFGALAHPFSSLFATGAVLRLGTEQIAQIVGYLESANLIPAGWFPHRRVLLVTDIDRSVTVDGTAVVETSGAWERRASPLRFEDGPSVPLPGGALEPEVRSLLDGDHPVHLGVATPDGPVALAATWAGDGAVRVSAEALGILRADLPGPASVVVDDSTSRRPDRKRGAMFRGRGTLIDVDGSSAVVTLQTERVTTWDGFDATTVDVADRLAVGAR